MNEARVRRLAAEGQVEITVKMLRRLARRGITLRPLIEALAVSELKEENVLAYPDFACRLGTKDRDRAADLVCVQTPDGRTVRIVGYLERKRPAAAAARKSGRNG
jgi:hypothetical protein